MQPWLKEKDCKLKRMNFSIRDLEATPKGGLVKGGGPLHNLFSSEGVVEGKEKINFCAAKRKLVNGR